MKIGMVLAVASALSLSACASSDPLRFARAAAVGAVNGVKAEAGLAIEQSRMDQLLALAAVCGQGGMNIATVHRIDIPSLDISGERFCASVMGEIAQRVMIDTALPQ
ncbi:MAG: hypothetical protein AAFR84_00915 [Pseudomonadota bacterium]